jgi:hypothetical protein
VKPISSLNKVLEDPLPGQVEPPPAPVIVNREEEYEVEHIQDFRSFQHQLQYLVKWNGYFEKIWELAVNVDGLQAINIFHAEQPGRYIS